MKKLFAMILALAMLLTLAACGDDAQSSNGDSVQGSTTETKWLMESETYVYEDPSLGTMTSSFTYDELGNVLSVAQNTVSGDLSVVYNYDENGRCVGMDLTQGDATMKYVFTLDGAGNRIKSEIYNGEELFQTSNCTFDKNGNMLTQQNINSSYESLVEYTYDEAGNVLGYSSSVNGELSSACTVEYDDQGRQLRSTTMDAQGNVSSVTEVTYDGNTETQITTAADGTVLTTLVKTRDDNGNVVAMELSGTNAMPYTYTATYISIEVPVSE